MPGQCGNSPDNFFGPKCPGNSNPTVRQKLKIGPVERVMTHEPLLVDNHYKIVQEGWKEPDSQDQKSCPVLSNTVQFFPTLSGFSNDVFFFKNYTKFSTIFFSVYFFCFFEETMEVCFRFCVRRKSIRAAGTFQY